jgi:trk system potassium uptake protein TrkA
MELSGEYAIAEIQPPKAWLGKDLKTLNVRARYGVSVLSIIGKGSGNVRMSPGAEDVVAQGDTVMIMGKHADLDRLQKL